MPRNPTEHYWIRLGSYDLGYRKVPARWFPFTFELLYTAVGVARERMPALVMTPRGEIVFAATQTTDEESQRIAHEIAQHNAALGGNPLVLLRQVA